MPGETIDSVLVSSNETTEKFKNILKSNGITSEVSDVIVKDAGLKSEGFASQTHYVAVHFKDDKLKPLNLFVKTETTSASHSQFLEETKLFEKESTFFTKYLPAASELCKDKGAEDLLEIYPKCYFGDAEGKMIVFENLVLDRGFELLDKAVPQGFDAACLALTTMAKHHGISHAMIQEMGGAEKLFDKFPSLDFEIFRTPSGRSMMESSLETGMTSNIQILEKCIIAGKEEAIELLKAKSGKIWDTIMETTKNDPIEDQILILNHGDYHNNNMLFLRDKTTEKLVSQIPVDFQAMRYGSPALDVSNYLYSTVDPEVRRSRLRDLLEVYLDVFNSTTEKLGHPVSLSYDELYRIYCKKVTFGIWFVGMLVVSTASFHVMKEIDITTVDLKDWGTVFVQLCQKWMESNPEACETDARKIIAMMREYKELVLENNY